MVHTSLREEYNMYVELFIPVPALRVVFSYQFLGLSSGISDVGGMNYGLPLCLLLSWFVVFLCIIRGIKSAGKVAYVMATFPYVILTVLMLRAFTLDGYLDGIQYYFTPDWSRLADGAVWYDAAVQTLFSLGTCYGGLILLSSYNHFHNNCARDAVLLSLGDFGTSTFAGFVIFAIMGIMARNLDTTVDNVIESGTGLAFIAIPDAVNKLPISPLWSFLFFLMLFLLGLDSQMVMVEVVAVSIVEEVPRLFEKKIYVTMVICCVMCVLGLPMVTNGGSYILVLLDSYIASWPILLLAVMEPMAVAWLYGMDRVSKDVKSMVNSEPSPWWRATWSVICPLIILFVLVFEMYSFHLPTYDSYVYPWWAHLVGWILVVCSICPIPIYAVYIIYKANGSSFISRLKSTIEPAEDYGPMLEKNRQYAAYFNPELERTTSISTTASDNCVTPSPYFRRHILSPEFSGTDVITTSPKRLGDVKGLLNKDVLDTLVQEGIDDDILVQKRPTKPAPVRDAQTQTLLSPIDEETNEVELHQPAPSYKERYSSSGNSIDEDVHMENLPREALDDSTKAEVNFYERESDQFVQRSPGNRSEASDSGSDSNRNSNSHESPLVERESEITDEIAVRLDESYESPAKRPDLNDNHESINGNHSASDVDKPYCMTSLSNNDDVITVEIPPNYDVETTQL